MNSSPHKTHNDEILSGDRFSFGENWSRFLTTLDEEKIDEAVQSLRSMLEIDSLHGKTFLDIDSGTGLFSLADMVVMNMFSKNLLSQPRC